LKKKKEKNERKANLDDEALFSPSKTLALTSLTKDRLPFRNNFFHDAWRVSSIFEMADRI